jgi:hypothetical protein
MRQSLRKTLLWQGVGLLFYLAGMVLFLAVAVNAFLAPPANSFGTVTTGDIAVLLVSVGLLVLGRAISWKLGGDVGGEAGAAGALGRIRGRNPNQSRLEELGYRMPPEESDDSSSDTVYEDGEVYVRCPECGEPNERGFDYCGTCSGELPD